MSTCRHDPKKMPEPYFRTSAGRRAYLPLSSAKRKQFSLTPGLPWNATLDAVHPPRHSVAWEQLEQEPLSELAW